MLASPIASVEVHADPGTALSDWRSLATTAPSTPYATPDWILPWIEAIARPAGVLPMIVVARGRDGEALALLPFGIRRHGVLAVAEFLGGRDSNFNMGLFAPGTAWSRDALGDLLGRAAKASGRRIDLFAFRNQPHAWQGHANPMAVLPHQPSPSFAFKTSLRPDGEALLQTLLSRENRKKLRHKMNRLHAIGPVAVVEARTRSENAELLDAFIAQRRVRDAALGLGGADLPALRRFLDLTVGNDGAISFYGLRCGDRIVATLGGTRGRDRFSGMLMSFAADAEIARTSPGELLLSEVMKRQCAAGLATFDLGVGEARYKSVYCPEVEPLFDSVIPLTVLGVACARTESARLRIKRAVKQSPRAWSLVQRLRRLRVLVSGPRG